MSQKNVLLILTKPINYLSEEAVLAVFAMASFEHRVQIALRGKALKLLQTPEHKLYKMLTSITLYDMEAVWLISANRAANVTIANQDIVCIEVAEADNQWQTRQQVFDLVWEV